MVERNEQQRKTMKKTNMLPCLALPGLALRCPVSLTRRSTQLQLTATDARLYEIDHHWTTPCTRVTRLIHSTRDDAYKVHNITHDPLSRIDSIHCNRSNQERGRVTDPRNKEKIQTACEYPDDKQYKKKQRIRTFFLLKHGNPKHQIQGIRLWLVHL